MKQIVLHNGIRVIALPYEGTQAATVFVMCKVGSRYERPDINGAAHYIEHLMFKGTKRRPNTLSLSRELDSVGAEYNAYTGKDVTAYYVRLDATKIGLGIDILHDMLTQSLFEEVEMNRERGVIIEEINMYHDNPLMHVEDLLESCVFSGSTLGWEIAGSHATMREMTRGAVLAFRDEHYIGSKIVVVVAGKIDEKAIEDIEHKFGSIPKNNKDSSVFTPFDSVNAPASCFNVEHKDTKQMQLSLGFHSYAKTDARLPALGLLSTILGGTMSSRLFINVRERRGLGYFIRSGMSPYEDTGVFSIQAGLDTSRLKEAVDAIVHELERMQQEGVSDEELMEAKDHIKGSLLLHMENSSIRAEWFGKSVLFLDTVETPEEYIKKIFGVKKENIQSIAQELFSQPMYTAAIGPYENLEKFMAASGMK